MLHLLTKQVTERLRGDVATDVEPACLPSENRKITKRKSALPSDRNFPMPLSVSSVPAPRPTPATAAARHLREEHGERPLDDLTFIWRLRGGLPLI